MADNWRYTASDLWLRREGEIVVVGVTAAGVERCGLVTAVGLPVPGAQPQLGMSLGYLEVASGHLVHLRPPVRGEIVAVNDELLAQPSLINEDPYSRGWILSLRLAYPQDWDDLETSAEYEAAQEPIPVRGDDVLPPHLLGRSEPVFLIDERRRVLACNAAAEEFTGLSIRELAQHPLCKELLGCQWEDGEPVRRSNYPRLKDLALNGPRTCRYWVVNGYGQRCAMDADYTAMVEPGRPSRAIIVLHVVD